MNAWEAQTYRIENWRRNRFPLERSLAPNSQFCTSEPSPVRAERELQRVPSKRLQRLFRARRRHVVVRRTSKSVLRLVTDLEVRRTAPTTRPAVVQERPCPLC